MVSKIDYLWDNSFPVNFCVVNNGERVKFECGITNSFNFEGKFYDEYQYLFREIKMPNGRKHHSFIDLQDPDCMVFEEIGNMLRKKCGINDESVIYLYDKSFSGQHKNIDDGILPRTFEVTERALTYELDLTDGVTKGIEWFKKIIGEDNILISTEPDKFVDLNGMDGSCFAFLFSDRKVLYYDITTSAICTYCPKNAIKTKEYKSYKRIESNDKFNWILLYVCNGEDLLSRTKLCFVDVQDEFGECIFYEYINEEKVNSFFNEIVEKAFKTSECFGNE